MRFKSNKIDIISKVHNAVDNNTYVNFYNILDCGSFKSASQSMIAEAQTQIQQAIKQSVKAAFCELIDNIYTEEEFEKDIGLTK